MPRPKPPEPLLGRQVRMSDRHWFTTWSQANLVKFAQEAYVLLCQQDDRIQMLQCDLKTAIEAYRALTKE